VRITAEGMSTLVYGTVIIPWSRQEQTRCLHDSTYKRDRRWAISKLQLTLCCSGLRFRKCSYLDDYHKTARDSVTHALHAIWFTFVALELFKVFCFYGFTRRPPQFQQIEFCEVRQSQDLLNLNIKDHEIVFSWDLGSSEYYVA